MRLVLDAGDALVRKQEQKPPAFMERIAFQAGESKSINSDSVLNHLGKKSR